MTVYSYLYEVINVTYWFKDQVDWSWRIISSKECSNELRPAITTAYWYVWSLINWVEGCLPKDRSSTYTIIIVVVLVLLYILIVGSKAISLVIDEGIKNVTITWTQALCSHSTIKRHWHSCWRPYASTKATRASLHSIGSTAPPDYYVRSSSNSTWPAHTTQGE